MSVKKNLILLIIGSLYAIPSPVLASTGTLGFGVGERGNVGVTAMLDIEYSGLGAVGLFGGKAKTLGVGVNLFLQSEVEAARAPFVQIGIGAYKFFNKPDTMGTSLQFHLFSRMGVKTKGLSVSWGHDHWSNGKKIFGWSGPNYGEDVISFSIGHPF